MRTGLGSRAMSKGTLKLIGGLSLLFGCNLRTGAITYCWRSDVNLRGNRHDLGALDGLETWQ